MRAFLALASLALTLPALSLSAQSLRERLRQELEEARQEVEQVRQDAAEAIEGDDADEEEQTGTTPAAAERSTRSADAATPAASRRGAAPATPATTPAATPAATAGRTRGVAEPRPVPGARTLDPSSPEVAAAVRAATEKSEQCANVDGSDPQRRDTATSCTQLCGMLIEKLPEIAATNADALPQMQFLCDIAHAQALGQPTPAPPR
jgi:hypothetical protein